MSNDDFVKAAEKVTMKKLLDLASRMIRAEEIVAEMATSFAASKKSDHALRKYLLQKAEIARLGREIDKAIRSHEILCRECGEPHKLRSVTPLGVMPRVMLRCPRSTGSYKYISKAEEKSLERISRFVQGGAENIFGMNVS